MTNKNTQNNGGWNKTLTSDDIDWLKTHTIGDLKDYAATLEYEGQDVSEYVQVIEDLMGLAGNLGYSCDDSFAYYDLLEFVGHETAMIAA